MSPKTLVQQVQPLVQQVASVGGAIGPLCFLGACLWFSFRTCVRTSDFVIGKCLSVAMLRVSVLGTLEQGIV